MNGVLIKPLSLMSLENELARYFRIVEYRNSEGLLNTAEEYTFDVFSNLLRDKPNQVLVILQEIQKVHDEVLETLQNGPVSEVLLKSLIHKIKGGAQLLGAPQFIQACDHLETVVALPEKIEAFQRLLKTENQNILRHLQKLSGS
jgi:two-component system sensor histidine kinase EvgS